MNELKPKLEPLKVRPEDVDDQHGSLYEIQYHKEDPENQEESIRFSIAIANTGAEKLHVRLGDEIKLGDKVIAYGKQLIYKKNAEIEERNVGYFEKHIHVHHGTGHDSPHWHYEGLAALDLLSKDGNVASSCKKTSYCVVDIFKYQELPGSPSAAQFSPISCRDKNDVGISVGWADYYRPQADHQYIPISNIQSGEYSIRFKIKPTKMLYDIGTPAIIRIYIDKENGKVEIMENP